MNIVGIVSFFAKIMPVSAMKACFQIAECSFFYAKIHIFLRKTLKNPCYYNNK